MKHKHAEVAHAYIDGKECEYWSHWDKRWQPISAMSYFNNLELKVRIKPEPKPDAIRYYNISQFGSVHEYKREDIESWDLEITFDGETGALKNAKVIR
jgi:hypothetical protein